MGGAGSGFNVGGSRGGLLVHMASIQEQREARERAEDVLDEELDEQAALDAELAGVQQEIAQHIHAGHRRPREDTGAFGALAGGAPAARVRSAAAPSMAAVPERGGAFRRPRKDTYVPLSI